MKQLIEQIKDSVLPLITVCSVIGFLFVGFVYNGNTGIFEIVGDVPSEEITDTQIHETPEEMETLLQAPMPEIKAQDRVYKTQEQIIVAPIFTVIKDNVTYSGTQGAEGGFTLNLTGVTRQDGSEVMEEMTVEEFENMEEITFSCIYDRQKDILLFVQSGVYKLHITCRLSNGATGRFVVTIPVEAFYNTL